MKRSSRRSIAARPPSRGAIAARFLAIAAVIYLLLPAGPRPVIRIGEAERALVRAEAVAESGRLPDDRELERRLEAAVEDEILVREAFARGLAAADGTIRRRLVRAMRFAGGEAEAADERLYDDAVALGFGLDDAAVRRRLLQRLRAEIAAEACAGRPTDEELTAAIAARATGEAAEPLLRLRHLYFSRTRRGAGAEGDAERARALLGEGLGGPSVASDPFPAGARLAAAHPADVARWLGDEVAAAVAQLREGEWSPPLRSPYGVHVVRVEERTDAAAPSSVNLRASTAAALAAECGARAVRETINELRREYEVVVE